MNIIIYFCSFIIAAFILYLIINDLKKFKLRLYNEIDYKIWIKVYSLISIGLIHAIWLFNALFNDDIDNSIIYGIPFYLLLPYFIFIITEIRMQNDCDMTSASEKINKYINYLVYIYFFCIITIMIIPNDIKRSVIICIKSIIDKYIICDK
jgi:hypothetical protein